MVAARNRPVWRGLRRPRHLGRPGQRLDASRHQPRGDVQVHHVVEHRVACRGGCPVQERHRDRPHTVGSHCTAFFVSPTGHIATAGHCVEWSGSKTVAARNNVIAKLKEEGVTVEKTGVKYQWAGALRRPDLPRQAALGQRRPAGARQLQAGRARRLPELRRGATAPSSSSRVSRTCPSWSIATQRPGERDTVIYAGFPADVEDLTLDDLQTPTVKEGKVAHSASARKAYRSSRSKDPPPAGITPVDLP